MGFELVKKAKLQGALAELAFMRCSPVMPTPSNPYMETRLDYGQIRFCVNRLQRFFEVVFWCENLSLSFLCSGQLIRTPCFS